MKLIKPGMQDQEPIGVKVFLAGSIEMGSAEDWQSSLVEKFEDLAFLTLYNPRRDDWNSDWHADSREMIEQVNWEMNKLEDSDIIFMYFSPGTKSPISLLELGLHAASNIIVCCPTGFWRKANVDIVCTRYRIPLYETLESALRALRTSILKIDVL
jgi:hypothetical protein